MKINIKYLYISLYLFTTFSCDVITTNNDDTFCYKICDEVGGTCISDQICQCKDTHTTLPEESSHKLCNYQKKSKILFSVLELVLGFGIGHLYAERKVNGFLKLIIYFMLCCVACCAIGLGLKFERERPEDAAESQAVKFFFFIYACIFNLVLTWQLFDFLMIIFGFYKDGNEIGLS
jgi:hypothetical protein